MKSDWAKVILIIGVVASMAYCTVQTNAQDNLHRTQLEQACFNHGGHLNWRQECEWGR